MSLMGGLYIKCYITIVLCICIQGETLIKYYYYYYSKLVVCTGQCIDSPDTKYHFHCYIMCITTHI